MEDLFAANPRNLKLPTTSPALLLVCPSVLMRIRGILVCRLFFHRALTHAPAQPPLQPCSTFNTLSVVSVWPSRGKIFSTL
jgi:hypothetical protein